jgi:predicted AlkP superfamily phosphohydrolase/phosphomutase
MLGFLRKPKKRICVIGLDGVPYSLLRVLAADGTMPAMAELCAQGHLRPMKVTLPEISAVSWTSFMTGAGPGTHGIFGFIDLKPGSKETRFPTFRDVQVPTLWDRLGQKSQKSVVINQPSTYPARPIQGVLVSGFVALDLRKAVFPARLLPDLKRINYETDIDTQRARADHDYLIQSLHSTLEGRRSLVDLVWDREEWDYFQVVITGTDRVQHYLWNAIADTTHPYHTAVRQYYRAVDRFIAEIVERYRKKAGREQGLTGLFLLSDHGFTGIKREFNLNAWLRQEGYQRLEQATEPTLQNLLPDSRAFALDPSRIYFNRKDRFRDGCVETAEVGNLTEEISSRLLALRNEGEPVVREVFRRADIYSGPCVPHGPDLIVLTHSGYDTKGNPVKNDVFTETDLQGMHTWDDAFFWAGESVDGDLMITDLATRFERFLS